MGIAKSCLVRVFLGEAAFQGGLGLSAGLAGTHRDSSKPHVLQQGQGEQLPSSGRNCTREILHGWISRLFVRENQHILGQWEQVAEENDPDVRMRLFCHETASECAPTAQVFLGSCSMLLGKQDVDIISFPVIKPIVTVQWKKPSWQCWAISLWKDPVSDFSSLIPSPSKLQVGDPRGLLLCLLNTLPSSSSLFEPERQEKRHLELGTGKKLAWKMISERVALGCAGVPMESSSAM